MLTVGTPSFDEQSRYGYSSQVGFEDCAESIGCTAKRGVSMGAGGWQLSMRAGVLARPQRRHAALTSR